MHTTKRTFYHRVSNKHDRILKITNIQRLIELQFNPRNNKNREGRILNWPNRIFYPRSFQQPYRYIETRKLESEERGIYLIVHVVPVAHVVAGAGTRLDVPPHVQLDLLPADTPARRHHCIAHAVTAGAIHPGIGLVQVSATGVVVSEAAGAPGIRGVSHAGLGTLLVSQPGLGPMEARRYILRHEQDFAVSWAPLRLVNY